VEFAPFCGKGCLASVLLCKGDDVVPVNAVQGRLGVVARDTLGDDRGTRCVLRFVETMLAEVGDVNCPPRFAVLLLLDHHPQSPSVVLTSRHPLQDPLLHVRLDISFDLGSEVQWYHGGLFAAVRDCFWLGVDPHWVAISWWPFLSFALVEGRILEVVFDPFLQYWDVTPGCWKWHLFWWVSKTPPGA
jgi:hypothetical protein